MIEDRSDWDCHLHVFDAERPLRQGHYAPATRGLDEIDAVAASQGVGHLVLVQPSVYGSDNSLLLDTLSTAAARGVTRHRGVIVLGDGKDARAPGPMLDEPSLNLMHALGVRGVRLNLVSPVGDAGIDLDAHIAAWAPQLRARGWHLQWYVHASQLGTVLSLHRRHALGCVLDHLAGMALNVEAGDPAWAALSALASLGAWVKLSGWYRLGARLARPGHGAGYELLLPQIQRVASIFADRLVWGSDWPHTGVAAAELPAYQDTWSPVPAALGSTRAQRARRAGADLYR